MCFPKKTAVCLSDLSSNFKPPTVIRFVSLCLLAVSQSEFKLS